MITKEHPLYEKFKRALRIEDALSSELNPFIVKCIEIAEQHAKEIEEEKDKYKSQLESFAKWTPEQCSWNDAGVRCKETAKQCLQSLNK